MNGPIVLIRASLTLYNRVQITPSEWRVSHWFHSTNHTGRAQSNTPPNSNTPTDLACCCARSIQLQNMHAFLVLFCVAMVAVIPSGFEPTHLLARSSKFFICSWLNCSSRRDENDPLVARLRCLGTTNSPRNLHPSRTSPWYLRLLRVNRCRREIFLQILRCTPPPLLQRSLVDGIPSDFLSNFPFVERGCGVSTKPPNQTFRVGLSPRGRYSPHTYNVTALIQVASLHGIHGASNVDASGRVIRFASAPSIIHTGDLLSLKVESNIKINHAIKK